MVAEREQGEHARRIPGRALVASSRRLLVRAAHHLRRTLPADADWRARLPILRWLPVYDRALLPGDLTAALVVAVMLVPQSMAYAMLAGLPPQVGLYASILPLVLYAVFGTSHALAVGPVAIVSLMVAGALTPLAPPASPAYLAMALTLALLSGLFLIVLGSLRIGFIANFLSHPVLAGFTTAAAIVIAVSQLRDLLGVKLASQSFLPAQIWSALGALPQLNIATVIIGALSLAALRYREEVARVIRSRLPLPGAVAAQLPKAMPLILVAAFTFLTWITGLSRWAGVAVIGAIPSGPPPVTLPALDPDVLRMLVVPAILISLVGFLESVAVGKSLASKRRRSIEPDQELIGLGAANLGAAFTGGFPVTGGLSRSLVNFSAGANTQLAAILTAAFVLVSIVLLTPMLYYLPKAVLAAIVVVAVSNLLDFASLRQAWSYDRLDGMGYVATFVAVLSFGVDVGILCGIAASLGLHLWRTSKPHIAVVGRVAGSEHFRNVLRHPVETHETLLLMRIDESLYFANAAYLEEQVLAYVTTHPRIQHFVLLCSAVNAIDASALETLVVLRQRLADMGIVMHLAEVKGPVTDRLMKTSFLDDLRPGRLFLSAHDAVEALAPGEPAVRSTPALIRNLRRFG